MIVFDRVIATMRVLASAFFFTLVVNFLESFRSPAWSRQMIRLDLYKLHDDRQRKCPVPRIKFTDLKQFANRELNTVGDDIIISPNNDGVVKIIMKCGGSSLADAERVVYVAKYVNMICLA